MMTKNGKEYFPPLRLIEDTMTNKQVLETINTAMSGDAAVRVTNRGNIRTVTFDQENQMHREYWEEFYEDLNQYGAVWIKAEYVGDEVYECGGIVYHTSPQPGHWEVQYARRKSKRPWPPVQPTVPEPKVCTCKCMCGARTGEKIGTSF